MRLASNTGVESIAHETHAALYMASYDSNIHIEGCIFCMCLCHFTSVRRFCVRGKDWGDVQVVFKALCGDTVDNMDLSLSLVGHCFSNICKSVLIANPAGAQFFIEAVNNFWLFCSS